MNSDASSEASTCQFFWVPSAWIAAIGRSGSSRAGRRPSWRTPAPAAWRRRCRRPAPAPGCPCVAVPPLPSLTVSLTVLAPAVVNVVDAVAPVASAVPLPSKSHEYVSASPSASVAAAVNDVASGAKPAVGVAVAEVMTGVALVGPVAAAARGAVDLEVVEGHGLARRRPPARRACRGRTSARSGRWSTAAPIEVQVVPSNEYSPV